MRTWIFVKSQERCGNCGELLPAGSAAQELHLHGVKRRRYRGECCAGNAPPELPSAPMLMSPQPLDLSRLAALIPNRTRGALKSMAREHLAAESESAIPPSLPRPVVSHLRMDRPESLTAPRKYLPYKESD